MPSSIFKMVKLVGFCTYIVSVIFEWLVSKVKDPGFCNQFNSSKVDISTTYIYEPIDNISKSYY